MRVKFKQAVRLPSSGPNGKDYSRGTHDVPAEVVGDKFFHKLALAGLVEDGDAAKSDQPVSPQDRQAQFLDKIAHHAGIKLEAAKAVEAQSAKAAPLPSEKALHSEAPKDGDATSQAPQSGEAESEADDKKADFSKKHKHKK